MAYIFVPEPTGPFQCKAAFIKYHYELKEKRVAKSPSVFIKSQCQMNYLKKKIQQQQLGDFFPFPIQFSEIKGFCLLIRFMKRSLKAIFKEDFQFDLNKGTGI